jgi:hypothetical protein
MPPQIIRPKGSRSQASELRAAQRRRPVRGPRQAAASRSKDRGGAVAANQLRNRLHELQWAQWLISKQTEI